MGIRRLFIRLLFGLFPGSWYKTVCGQRCLCIPTGEEEVEVDNVDPRLITWLEDKPKTYSRPAPPECERWSN
jgi:hypothetical protein